VTGDATMPPDQLRLRQVCLVAPALEPAVEEMGAVLGLPVCHRDPKVGVFGLENALFVAGTTFLEIVAPVQPGTAASRFLERTGGDGGYIAIFDCADPDARKTHALSMGVAVAHEIDRPGQYRCVQLHPRDCRATMLEFDRTVGGDELSGTYWPAGGDGWQAHADPRVTRGVRGLEAVGPDPEGLARHWAAILDRPLDGGAVHLDNDARIRFLHGEGRERLDAVLLDAADPDHVLREGERRGLLTGDGGVRMSGMTFRVSRA